MPKALLVENIHPGAATLLRNAGFEVETLTKALDEHELLDAAGDVELIGIRSRTHLTEKVLDAAGERLMAVGAFCIGTNQIDLGAATSRGVAVFNAPFSNTRSVVELVIGEIIALTRRLTVKDQMMHAGVWDKSADGAHEVRGRRLGIVGYGNIGTQLSVVAEALGMSVIFYDTADRLALGNARRAATLDELLEVADVVTLHVDGRPDNAGFFGEAEFDRMKRGALFLNLSRGFVVDHAALAGRIRDGALAGAALDVFATEPAGRDDPFESELRGLPNVILTPHIGGSTEEAQADIGQFVAAKLVEYATVGATGLSVNLPRVGEVPSAGEGVAPGWVLAHLHRNVPGVLAAINGILGEHGVNIEGQALATRGEVGYVLTSVAARCDDEVVARLQGMPETVRLRVL